MDLFSILLGRANVNEIAGSREEFQTMDMESLYSTLLHLQQTGQFQLGHNYMNSLDGPVTSEIRHMAASEGITLDV